MTSTGERIVSDGRRRARRGGFSLLEVAIGTVVLTMGISAVLSVIVKYSRMVRVNNESTIAQMAARQMIERMQEQTFAQIFALYNTSTADDPGGAGTAPGAHFVVAGLQVQRNDADGRVGEILFPVSGTQLRENVTDLPLGMPRDLNGNGATDALNHAADYVLLPVTIRLRWRGPSGNRSLTIRHLLTAR